MSGQLMLIVAGWSVSGVPSSASASSGASGLSPVVPEGPLKQHRWSIDAAPAASMDHRCRFRAGADPDTGRPGEPAEAGGAGGASTPRAGAGRRPRPGRTALAAHQADRTYVIDDAVVADALLRARATPHRDIWLSGIRTQPIRDQHQPGARPGRNTHRARPRARPPGSGPDHRLGLHNLTELGPGSEGKTGIRRDPGRSQPAR